MRFNAYNRAPGPTLDGIDKDRVPASVAFVGPSGVGSVESLFAIDAGSPLASGGCRVQYANGKLTCDGTGGLVGAVLPNRERFDVELPFGFPFIDVLRDATRPGSPR